MIKQAEKRVMELLNSKKVRKSLVVVLLAALLLELVSAAQYYFSRYLLQNELENRVLLELKMELHTLDHTLMSAEQTLQEHLWDITNHLGQPDSMFAVTERLIAANAKIVGGCLPFAPDYYPEKGRLFEPYAYKDDGEIKVEQLAGKNNHDYSTNEAFIQALKEKRVLWSDPYDFQPDDTSAIQSLSTYTYPIIDSKGEVAAVCGLDVSLSWLGDTLNAAHEKSSMFNLFLTSSGSLITGPSAQKVSAERINRVVALLNDSTVERNITKNNKVQFIKFYDKEMKDNAYVYYTSMESIPYWQVAMVCYDKEVYGSLETMRLYISLLMLLGFILLGVIIFRTIRNARRLELAHIEKDRIDGELRVAYDIQKSMLPKRFPPYPERSDIDIYGQLVPAREVGGDLFDFFIRDEKLFFCIGDVSGKGVPSAIIMAQVHSLFRIATANNRNPAHVLQILNDQLCQNNDSNMFITFFIGVLDLPTGRLRYCDAGHDCPVLVGQGLIEANPHLPLGVFSDVYYVQEEMVLTPGSMLFLYTDGLTEAFNAQRCQFGLQRVLASLTVQDSCEALIHHMTDTVHRFVENAEQSDDLTMLAIRYQRRQYADVLHEEIVLKNDIRQTPQLNAFVKQVGARLSMDDTLVHNIRLAVEEAVVNVMEYAYPEGQEGNVTVAIQSNGEKLKITITDSGIPFDPTEQKMADTTLDVEDRPIGGLGLLMVRELMDSVNYERDNGHNVLTLRKKYNDAFAN